MKKIRKSTAEYEKNRKRNRSIHVRCTEEEYNIIAKNAEKAKLSISPYLVMIGKKNGGNITNMKPVLEMNVQINKIGTNINQVAHHVNANDYVLKSDLEYIRKQLVDIQEKYNIFFDKVCP